MFGIRELNAYQREAIVQFVQKKTDVFVNLQTGYGKSLIYQALPFVYDSILEAAGHIAWLKNERWRKVLSSEIYRSKLCAIAVDETHVIKQWEA